MRRLFYMIMILLMTCLASAASAESLKFKWGYPEGQPTFEGFRIYRDGNILDTDKIQPATRSITIPQQTDKKSHTYHIVAYNGALESKSSNAVIDPYIQAEVAPTGVLTIEVIQ